MLTEHDVMERLRSAITEAGSQRKFAEQHGLTVAYVSDVLRGNRALADRILAALGIERQVTTTVTYRLVVTPLVTPDPDQPSLGGDIPQQDAEGQ